MINGKPRREKLFIILIDGDFKKMNKTRVRNQIWTRRNELRQDIPRTTPGLPKSAMYFEVHSWFPEFKYLDLLLQRPQTEAFWDDFLPLKTLSHSWFPLQSFFFASVVTGSMLTEVSGFFTAKEKLQTSLPLNGKRHVVASNGCARCCLHIQLPFLRDEKKYRRSPPPPRAVSK